jgi:Tol biopolymer transport system component
MGRRWGAIMACAALCATLWTTPANAAFPGQNGKIAYSHGGDIWTVDPDGTNAQQITTGSAREDQPNWSPDGTQIAFVTTRADPNPGTCSRCIWEIDVMDADGTDTRVVVPGSSFPATFSGGEAAWSPDGTRIAFADGLNLWTIATDGTDKRLVPSSTTAECRAIHGRAPVAWSPDGTRLLSNGDYECFDSPDPASFIVTIASGLTSVTYNAGELTHDDWSPDGGSILLGAYAGGHGGLQTRGPGGITYLTPCCTAYADGYGGNTAWSPDGTTVVFRRDDVSGNSPSVVYLIDADGGGNLRPLGGPHVGSHYNWQPISGPRRSDYRNAAKFCKGEREFVGDEAFRQKYGGGANAHGKCVSGN